MLVRAHFFPRELDFPIPLSVTISKAFSFVSQGGRRQIFVSGNIYRSPELFISGMPKI